MLFIETPYLPDGVDLNCPTPTTCLSMKHRPGHPHVSLLIDLFQKAQCILSEKGEFTIQFWVLALRLISGPLVYRDIQAMGVLLTSERLLTCHSSVGCYCHIMKAQHVCPEPSTFIHFRVRLLLYLKGIILSTSSTTLLVGTLLFFLLSSPLPSSHYLYAFYLCL